MRVLRTPDERFARLPDFPYPPHYADVHTETGEAVRIAWVEAGPSDGEPVLLLHGEPTWSFLWHKVIPVLAGAGLRAIAVDLVGFGRSDKPTDITDHTYARHVAWVRELCFDVLELRKVTLVAHDWGGLIGLRLAAENLGRFARLIPTNTALPTGDGTMPDPWWAFKRAIKVAPTIDFGMFVSLGVTQSLPPEVRDAYAAPFPDDSYCAGPRALPEIVPVAPDDPASQSNRAAWRKLVSTNLPALVAFSDGDPLTGALGPIFKHRLPGAKGLHHPVYHGASHFTPEDAGPELAGDVVAFIADTPTR